MLHVDRVDHLVLTVVSIEDACAFYVKLGLARVNFAKGRVGVECGGPGAPRQRLAFHEVGHVVHPRAARATVGAADFCLIVQESMEAILAQLAKENLTVELGPVARSGACGEMQSVYLRDPDNNLVEIATYHP